MQTILNFLMWLGFSETLAGLLLIFAHFAIFAGYIWGLCLMSEESQKSDY